MKAILMSIKPQHVTNILNGLKTLEIRKRFPSDYVGWVYIYATKQGKYATKQGKVVARFWCDKVEEIIYEKDELKQAWGDLLFGFKHLYHTRRMAFLELVKKSCLAKEEMHKYLKGKDGYAIHIANLEIFDKPKEIKKFRRYCDKHFNWWTNRCLDCKAYTPDIDIEDYCNENKLALTKAPQSYCFVEV